MDGPEGQRTMCFKKNWRKVVRASCSFTPLLFIFLMADNNSPIWSRAQLSSSIDGASSSFLKWRFWSWSAFDKQIEFPDPGIVVHENVSFGFAVGDGATILWYDFIWWIDIWGTFQTLNDFQHIWYICARHSILKKIFPTFSFCLVYSLGCFTTYINPLLLVSVDFPTKAIGNAVFSSHLGSHPRFGFCARLSFPNVRGRCRCQNVIKTSDTLR